MRILGIDPGLGLVGFGLIEVPSAGELETVTWGVISTSKDKTDSARLQEIYDDLLGLLDHLKPDVVSVERIFFFRNATTMVPVSQARGVILLALEKFKLPLYEYTPMQVKQAITGYGKAKKPEIQQTLLQMLKLEKLPRPDDAADALALAICHYNHVGRYEAVVNGR